MDVWRITVAAVRRWYVLLPLLGVTALMVIAADRGVQPEYDVEGTSMVVPGRVVPRVPNPYGSPDDANNAVAIVLNSPATRASIAEQGLIANYEVGPQSRSTIMNFQVRGASPEVAVETGIAVFQQAALELRERQTAAGIRPNQQYTLDVLQTPSVSEAVTNGRLRNMAVVGVLGGAVSLAIAVFFDDILGLWRRSRRRRTQSQQEPESSSELDSATQARTADEAATPGTNRTPAAAPGTAGDRHWPRDPGVPSREPRKPKQPKKAKKAALAESRDSAASVSRGTPVSDTR